MDVIRTGEAPEAVGAYSQGRISGGSIVTSGQIGLDPVSGELLDESARAEIRQTVRNVIAVVRAGGGDKSTIVKTRVFLKDLEEYEVLNGVYNDFFEDPLPARTVTEVSNLPAGARVEIEGLAERTEQ